MACIIDRVARIGAAFVLTAAGACAFAYLLPLNGAPSLIASQVTMKEEQQLVAATDAAAHSIITSSSTTFTRADATTQMTTTSSSTTLVAQAEALRVRTHVGRLRGRTPISMTISSTSTSSTTTPCITTINSTAGSRNKSDIKLVINSHVRYSVPLEMLLESMVKAGFNRWHDVVVVRGSASCKAIYHPNTSFGELGITYVDITWMNYDYHGFAALYSERKHPLIRAGVYFYIHDSCIVDNKFPKIFNSMGKSVSKHELVWSGAFSSNICVFGSGVVNTYKRNFETFVPKRQSLEIEAGGCHGNVCNIQFYAKKKTNSRARRQTGLKDFYHTGHARTEFYYDDLGVYKYIFWGRDGDFTGKIKSLDGGRRLL